MAEALPIVIAGAGPAGMVLAYQLASNGVPVRVLERHEDFDREFRGEFLQPSILAVLEELGIGAALRAANKDTFAPIRAVRMHLRTYAFATSTGANGDLAGQAVHQPSLLGLLHELCSKYPCYRLDFQARVDGLSRDGEGGRVTGVVARVGGREEHIPARLVVVCSGRNTALRKEVSADVEELETPYSLLWLRFDVSKRPELYPDTLDGYVTRKAFCVLYPTYGGRVQLMWRRSRKHLLDWKLPSERLREELVGDVPAHWRPIAEALDASTHRQVLRVTCDRMRKSWVPGALFLGDAAHTLSPIGGQGVAIAVRDTIVAANHLLDAERAGAPFDDALLAKIEAERRPEVDKIQAWQVRAGRINDAPPPAQWLITRVVVPVVSRLQGNYLKELQYGVTDVAMRYGVRVEA
jgi:2-polyprenyl-6-methoxyphenol hydroxylase-like FAD-dependent oxidoreductase